MPTSHRWIRAFAMVFLLAACGDGEDESGRGGTVRPTSDTTATTSGSGSTTTAEDGREIERVRGVGWGPDDPPIPDQYAAFAKRSTDDFDCESIDQNAPENDFWTTVSAVCRALRGDGGWPAGPLADPPPAANRFQDCMNAELATTIRAILGWAGEHPGVQPVLDLAQGTERSPCEHQIFDLAAYEVPPNDDCATGGVVVELQVPGLVEDAEDPPVLVDGQEMELFDDFDGGRDGLSFGQICVPAPVEARRARVEVLAYFGTVSGEVDLPDVEGDVGVPGTTTTTTIATTTTVS